MASTFGPVFAYYGMALPWLLGMFPLVLTVLNRDYSTPL